MLDDVITRLEAKGIVVLVSGVTDRHRTVLRRLGVAPHLRELGRVFAATPEAIAYARTLLPAPRKP
jgi:SulP family sulfate permease